MKTPPRSLPGLALLTAGLLTSQFAAANTALWIGNPGASASTNWSDNANWNNVGAGGAGALQNDVRFGGTGAAATAGEINNVVDTAQHPFSIAYTNGPGQFHTTLIPEGITLTNDNGLIVGGLTADAYTTRVDLTGGGTLLQLGTPFTVQNHGAAVSTALATLDLSALSNFVYTNSAGVLTIGGTGGNRSAGALNLAGASNFITAATINLGTGSGANAATSNLRLGAGTNIINVGTFNIVNNKNSATFTFLDANGGLRLRGLGGTDADRANFTIANRNQTGTGTTTGNLFLNGHPVDIKAGTMTVGQNSAGSSVNIGNGVIQFDTGTLDVTTLNLAVCSNPGAAAANGTITIGSGGTLIIGSGGLSLVNHTGAGSTGTGNLNIAGGTVTCAHNIIKTTSAASTGNLTMTGGSLSLASGKVIGTPALPLDNVNLTSATLNLAVLLNLTNLCASALNLGDDATTINITALPSIAGFPTLFPLASFTSLPGGSSVNLGTLPGGYSGYISNDTVSTLWLVVTNGTTVAKTVSWGGGVNNLWDTSTLNWTNAGVAVSYNEGDFVTFDDSAKTSSVNLTGARQPVSLIVSNNALDYTFAGSGSIGGAVTLVKAGSGTLTLSATGGDNLSGGLVVTNGTLILDNANSVITGGLIVGSGAIAQLGNNSTNGVLPSGGVAVDGTLVFKRTNDLIVTAVISGNGGLMQSGSGKITLSAANTYIGDTSIGAATLALTGTGTISNSAHVNVFGTLDLSTVSGPADLNSLTLISNANLTVAMPDTQTPLRVAALLNGGGFAKFINVASLPPISSYPVTLKIVQSSSPIGAINLALGSLPAATPAYAGSVGLSADQTAVELTLTAGPVGIRPAVFWTGADVANSNTNWSDGLNWLLSGAPNSSDNVIFNNTAATAASALTTPGGGASALDPASFNNFMDANFTLASLTYTNLGGTYHNTRLADGRTLNLTNTLTVGAIDAGSPATQLGVSLSGSAASVSINNPNANVQVWLGNGSANHQATLDLSALDNFTTTASRLTVGACAINNAVNRPSGVLYLAKTNSLSLGFQTTTIEAGTTTGNAGLVVADCNQNAGPASFLYLGQVNTIAADTIALARQKTLATLAFNPIYANTAPYPTATIQGFSSDRVSVFDVGSGAGNTGTTTGTGTADFSGGKVNLRADTLSVGRASTPASGSSAGTTTGVLTFDAGTINVNTLNVGLQPAAFHNLKVGIGTVNIGTNATIGEGASLIVNGNLNLAVNAGSATTTGTLNINGGSVEASTIIAGANGATSTINLTDGKLAIAGTAGTPAAPLTALNLTGGTLQLNADGNATTAALVATTITPNGTTLLNIGAITGVNATSTIPLISYTGTDPFANLTLGTYPAGYAVTLEDNTGNSTIDLRVVSTSKPKPFVTGFGVVGTTLTLQGTNGASGGEYVVLGSTNVALPLAQWTPLFTNVFAPDGSFNLSTNILNPALPRQFFILSQ